MDPLLLANAPLTSLVLIAFFWLLGHLVKFANQQSEKGAVWTARRSRLRFYCRYFSGNLANLLPTLAEQQKWLLENAQSAHDAKTANAKTSAGNSIIQRLSYLFSPPNPTASDRPPSDHDEKGFTFTKGNIDTQDLAEHLHMYRGDRAGLVMFIVEHKPYFETLLTRANEVGDRPDSDIAYLHVLNNMQFSAFNLFLATRAYCDDAFREKVSDLLDSKAVESADRDGQISLARSLIAEINKLTVGEFELQFLTTEEKGVYELRSFEEVMSDAFLTDSEITDEQQLQDYRRYREEYQLELLKDFDFSSLSVIQMKRRGNWWKLWWLVIAAYLLIFLSLLFVQPVREYLYPAEAVEYTCETQITIPDGEREVTCSYTADTLEGGVREGASIPVK